MRYFQRLASIVSFVFVGVLFMAAGCKQESASEPGGESPSAFQEVTVEISGMACAMGCAPRAEKALASLPWAKDVKVDFDRKRATFIAERARYDESAILKVLQDEEFEGKIVK